MVAKSREPNSTKYVAISQGTAYLFRVQRSHNNRWHLLLCDAQLHVV